MKRTADPRIARIHLCIEYSIAKHQITRHNFNRTKKQYTYGKPRAAIVAGAIVNKIVFANITTSISVVEFERGQVVDGGHADDGDPRNTAAKTHTLSRKIIAIKAVLPQPSFTALENLMMVKMNRRDSNNMEAILDV